MQKEKTELLQDVALYYSRKLAEHGETPQGVDWNSEEGQTVRFEQLCKIIQKEGEIFSLNDLGCGYGALFGFLQSKYLNFNYLGVDISPEMIQTAVSGHSGYSASRFINADIPDRMADYGVASGVFNVRLNRTDDEWFEYLHSTLDVLDSTSRLGFAFNCLTSYSDEHKKREYLYYADPCKLFDLCKRKYSRNVAVLHDYGLYEFTILVRKSL